MSIVKEGWIEKKGQTFMAGYKKRWLVLYSDKTLKYYEDNYYEILKGSIDISEAKNVQNCMEHSKNWKFGWEVTTPTRNWYFSSKTDHDRKQWIQNIQTVMDYTSLKSTTRLSYNKHKRLKNIAKEQQKQKHMDNVNNMSKSSSSSTKNVTTPLITHNDYESKANNVDDDDDDIEFGKEDERKANRTKSVDIDRELNIAKENMQNNSNKKNKSDEYVPGLYSSSFGRANRSPPKSPSSGDTVSKFGKDYTRMTRNTMTSMMNKHVNLSLKHKLLQENKNNNNEGKEDEQDDDMKQSRFLWEIYDGKIHDLLKKDENYKDDMDNPD